MVRIERPASREIDSLYDELAFESAMLPTNQSYDINIPSPRVCDDVRVLLSTLNLLQTEAHEGNTERVASWN